MGCQSKARKAGTLGPDVATGEYVSVVLVGREVMVQSSEGLVGYIDVEEALVWVEPRGEEFWEKRIAASIVAF